MVLRKRRTQRVVLAGSRVAAVGLVAATVTAVGTGDERVIGAVGLLVSLLTLGVESWSLLTEQLDPRAISPEEQADALAAVVRTQWREEAAARRLRDPGLLPLSWTRTQREVAEPAAAVLGPDVPSGARLRLDGRMAGDLEPVGRQLAQAYQRIPGGRLVVLGEPGAGKTVLALMLTLGLLDVRPAGGPVPLLLSASSWDPISQSLDEWLVHSLAHAYYTGQAEIPERLLRHGLVLPVLDGLDEIPEDQRRGAVAAINRAIRTDRPVVVTCRSVEYEDLITGGAPRLRRAPVIEMSRLDAADIVTYLSRLNWPSGTSWASVTAQLTADPTAPVSLALSTPLMVTVARTVYQNLGGDPDELTRTDVLDSRHAVEDLLTDRVVAAAYEPAGRWEAGTARGYLSFLADHLHRQRERDLVWWLLAPRLLSPWVGPALGIAGGVLLMVAIAGWIALFGGSADLSLTATIWIGAAGGGGFAVLVALFWFATAGRPPGRLSFDRKRSRVRLRRGFGSGFLAALIPVLIGLIGLGVTITVIGAWRLQSLERFLEGAGAMVSLCAVIGLGLALHHWLNAPSRVASPAGPLDLLRQDRRSAAVGALTAGLTVGALALPGLVVGAVVGTLASKLVSGWAGWPEPYAVRSLARAEAYDVTLGVFRTPSLVIGGTMVLPAIVVLTLVFLTRAWPRFLIARFLLAASGRLPWRLPAFLADARARDLLRQSGGAYQFRHIRVQEHLAHREPGREVGLPVPWLRRPRVRRVIVATAVLVLALGAGAVATIPHDGADTTLVRQHGSGVDMMVVSADGRWLAGADHQHQVVDLWDLRARRLERTFRVRPSRVKGLRFSENGMLLAADVATPDDERRTRSTVWDTGTGRVLGPESDAVVFIDGGRTVVTGTYGDSRRLEIWDPSLPQPIKVFADASLEAYGDRYFVIASPSGSPTGPHPFTVWGVAQRRPVANLEGRDTDLRTFGFSADENVVHARSDTREYYWRSDSGARLFDLPNGESEAVDTAHRHAALVGGGPEPGSSPARLQIWDTHNGRRLLDLPPQGEGFDALPRLRFSADERWIAVQVLVGDERQDETWIFDAATGERALRSALSSRNVFLDGNVLLDRNGGPTELLADFPPSAPEEYLSRFFELRTGRLRFTSPTGVEAISPAPDPGTSLAGNSWVGRDRSGRLQLLDVRTGRTLLTLPKVRGADTRFGFSPDGSMLLTARDDRHEVWDATSGRSIGRLEGLQGRPFSPNPAGFRDVSGGIREVPVTGNVVVSADSHYLLTTDGTSEAAQLWDLRTARLVKVLTGHTGPLQCIGFVPGRRTAITVGRSDDTVRLWDVPAD